MSILYILVPDKEIEALGGQALRGDDFTCRHVRLVESDAHLLLEPSVPAGEHRLPIDQREHRFVLILLVALKIVPSRRTVLFGTSIEHSVYEYIARKIN